MTVLPDKHTFTIWQGATFFEVLTLYETMDKTSPRDFCTETSISPALTVTTQAGSASANLSGLSNLTTNSLYSIYTDSTIPKANNISFSIGTPLPSSPYTVQLSSSTGVTAGTNIPAVIKKRTLNYSAEMLIRDKPQGTILHALRTENHDDYEAGDSLIVLPQEPDALGQIKLVIDDTVTKDFGKSTSWKTGVYDLTITNLSAAPNTPNITDALLYGGIKVNGV